MSNALHDIRGRVKGGVFQAAQEGPPLIVPQFHITFRVAEPAGLARRLPLLANDVTDQGLGEVTSAARNGAGNPVLYAVGIPQDLMRYQY